MRLGRSFLSVALSVSILGSISAGIFSALHSDLFIVRVVEVEDLPDNSPIRANDVALRAGVPVGKVNLFELDLDQVEQRILREPWVRSVRLQKRFPQTLAISVDLRTPKALIAKPSGKVAYVDSTGAVFGQLSLKWFNDLPLLTGAGSGTLPVVEFLDLIRIWEGEPQLVRAKIAELRWDSERGVRAFVRYGCCFRTWVDLGDQLASPEWDLQIPRLARVLEYLEKKNIAAHQVWADSDKKIVVKTASGS